MPTAIEWCDETFNPWWGCEKVSPGCAHCYAEKVSNHRSGNGNWGAGHGFRFFGDKHWDEPLRWARNLPAKLGRRPRVFCASMADVFEERPELDEHRLRLIALIDATPELDWLLLTKRPEFALDWLVDIDDLENQPPRFNLWLGVSIENARFTWRADVLREIPAAVRFISAEPLLGSLYDNRRAQQEQFSVVCRTCKQRFVTPGDPFEPKTAHKCAGCGGATPNRAGLHEPLDLTGIDWVIIGGESGPGARPFHLEHAREIIAAAYAKSDSEDDSLSPAVFVKQLGSRPIIDYDVDGHPCSAPVFGIHDRKGGNWDEWLTKAPDLRIREFPPVNSRKVAA